MATNNCDASKSTESTKVKGSDGKPAYPPTTVLLIGSTGNGKSTLGNFLLDPSDGHIFGTTQSFRTARDNKPETQNVSTGVTRVTGTGPLAPRSEAKMRAVRVIDTPGLNESATKDLTHMIEIVKALTDVESVSACILCMKFESKIDSQYKSTVQYYRKLLPNLFEGNVIIVLTQFQTDARSEKQRQLQGVKVDVVIDNARKAVREIADLCYSPQVFLIDSMPMADDEREASESTREALLDCIRSTMKPIKLRDLKVAKTAELKQKDDKEIERVDGEITGYNSRLKQANAKAEKVLSKIEAEEKAKSECVRKLVVLRSDKNDHDTDDPVTAVKWELEQEWKFFKSQSKEFEVTSPWQVTTHSKWDNGHLEWDDFEVTEVPGRAKGKVKGKFCRGLYASVTLNTAKRFKYSEKIKVLTQEIRHQQERLDRLKKTIDDRLEEHQECIEDIRLLRHYIDERNEIKNELSRDPIPVTEALERLQEVTF